MVRLGSDKSIQHHRSNHSTKTKSSQHKWEVVRVMRYDVHDTDQIPRTSIYLQYFPLITIALYRLHFLYRLFALTWCGLTSKHVMTITIISDTSCTNH
jgi:hypothetical protein